MFVGEETHRGYDPIRGTDGVAGIVGVGRNGPPVAVPASLVQAVSDQVAGIKKNAPAAFRRGQRVSVAAGPFAELQAIIEQSDSDAAKATVRLEMFGKSHSVEIGFGDLKAA